MYLSNFAHQQFALLLKVRLLWRRLRAICGRSTVCRHVDLFGSNVWLQERGACSWVGSPRTDHALSRQLQNSVCYLKLFSSIDHRDETTQVKVSQSLISTPGVFLEVLMISTIISVNPLNPTRWDLMTQIIVFTL